MKVLLAALGFRNKDMTFNMRVMQETMRQYAEKTDLIVFGETFLQGFDCLTWDFDKDVEMAVCMEGPVIAQMKRTAKETNTAISFGYVEKNSCKIDADKLYSSQITIGKNGEIIDNYRRVSGGWKETIADYHYCEGEAFHTFEFCGKSISIGLCGDLWYDDNVERIKSLNADVVLWPVYTDFNYRKWNDTLIFEYAQQSKRVSANVLQVNSVSLGQDPESFARGGAEYYKNGEIASRVLAGEEGVLLVEV